MPSPAEDHLRVLGFNSLPPEMAKNSEDMDMDKVTSLINDRHKAAESAIINKRAPAGVLKNRTEVGKAQPQLKAEFDKLDASKKELLDMLKAGNFTEEIKKMSETFKNGGAKNSQGKSSSPSEDWITAQREKYMEDFKEHYLNHPLAGAQQQVGPDNIFLYLINCTVFNFAGWVPDPFNPTAPENAAAWKGLQLESPAEIKDFKEAAEKEFGDDIDFVPDPNNPDGFKGILCKDESVQQKFDDWTVSQGKNATPDQLDQAKKQQLEATAAAKLSHN